MKWYKGYMKILKVFSGLLVLLIAGWWFASPYWVLYQVKQAVEENQPGKLSAYIYYPAVRQSLKSQLSQYLEQKMGFEQRSNPFEQFGAQLTISLTGYLVETLVNPYGVALLLQGKEFSEVIRLTRYERSSVVYHLPEPKKAAASFLSGSSVASASSSQTALNYKAGYLSMNRFRVQVPTANRYTSFILSRSGWSWKITAIELPQ